MLLDQLHRQAQNQLQRAVGGTVAGIVGAITLDRSPAVRDGYALATSRVVSAGQWQAAQLAATYIAAYAPPVRDLDLDRALDLATPDSPNSVVGLLRLWTLLDDGAEEEEARDAAGSYAGGLASADLQGATRSGLDEATSAAGREPRWRLEPNPGACEWCRFLADTGPRYLDASSVPVPHAAGGEHPGGACLCTPAPEFEEE